MIKIKCDNSELRPKLGTTGAAGMDLRSPVDLKLDPGQEVFLSLGLSIEIPKGTVGLIVPRSSTSKEDNVLVQLKNTIGVIDSDYRGELKCLVRNTGTKPYLVYKYDRFLQLLVLPCLDVSKAKFVESLSQTDRGSGGFGSTGIS